MTFVILFFVILQMIAARGDRCPYSDASPDCIWVAGSDDWLRQAAG